MSRADELSVADAMKAASPAPRQQALDARAIALLLVMCACLAVGQVAIKIANAGISPLLQAGLRSGAAAVLLGLYAWARGVRLFARDGTFWPGLLVSLFFTAEFALLYPGLKLTTAAHAVILLYTSPFVVALGAHFLIPGDRLTAPKLAGLLLAFAGVATVVLGREVATGAASNAPSLLGDLLCLGGAFAWGFLTLTIRASRLKTVTPERVTFMQLALSAPLLVGLSALLGEPGITDPTPQHWAAFAFTVVFVAFFVFTATNWLYMRYPASRVMAFLLLTPVFGVLAGHLILGEALSSTCWQACPWSSPVSGWSIGRHQRSKFSRAVGRGCPGGPRYDGLDHAHCRQPAIQPKGHPMFNPETPPELAVSGWVNAREPLTLAALKGRVVVLFAFQMLCPGCVEHAIPQVKRLRARFNPEQVAIIGLHSVFEHHHAMPPEALEVFVSEFKLPFPVAIDLPDGDAPPHTMTAYQMQARRRFCCSIAQGGCGGTISASPTTSCCRRNHGVGHRGEGLGQGRGSRNRA